MGEFGKSVEKSVLSALLSSYEPLQHQEDAASEIRSSRRPEGPRLIEPAVEAPAVPKSIANPNVSNANNKANARQQIKVEQGQKRPSVSVGGGAAAKVPRYLPTPAARTGYYGR